MQIQFLYSSLGLIFLIDNVYCTTNWFGDQRSYLKPPKSPPFYDIIYDETDCPFGLESVAIPDFVYFGEMIATKSFRDHSDCLQFCLETSRCKAVNFFESMSKKDPGMGFCELLVESQYDNPRLMRPFRKATYYEKIHCREATNNDDEDPKEEGEHPFTFNGKDLLIGENNKNETVDEDQNQAEGKRTHNHAPKAGKNESNHSKRQKSTKVLQNKTATDHGQADDTSKEETVETESALNANHGLNWKRLVEKVQEFNERFKS